MQTLFLVGAALLCASATAGAQQIVKVPRSDMRAVARPDDLFTLSAGQWHVAKHLWKDAAPCTPDQCEAGFTSGDLALSTEHSGEFVRIIAGIRGCEAVGSSEVEVGKSPGKPSFGRVRDQMKRVVKGVAKTCKVPTPAFAPLDVRLLFSR